MFVTNTVFVLGAGASAAYGFPSGKKLVDDICQNAPTMDFQSVGIDQASYVAFVSELRASKQASVDAFLEHRKEFELVGKKAIAMHLIKCEQESALFYLPSDKDWYTYILDRMTADTPFDKLGNNKIGFITFNYDRSLEHYLVKTITARYGKPTAEVCKVLNRLPIIHVHGRLGYLPWQNSEESTNPSNANNQRPYDQNCTAKEIDIAAQHIKIITEYIDTSPEFGNAQDLMAKAERIGILGFGYHPVNMRRLHVPISTKKVWGTCYGFTAAESDYLRGYRYRGLNLAGSTDTILDLLRNQPIFQLE
jgi:hypothetical protein